MSQYSESYVPHTGEPAAESSTAGVARDEAADLGQHVRQAGGQVTQTATDQTRQVAAEAGRQARDLLGEAQGQVRDQASTQQKKAAQQLRSVADELGQMTEKGGQDGLATDLTRQAAERLHGAASWLEQREPADLLDQVRSYARRRPGTFLIGAAVAGLAVGRLTRGLAAAHKDEQEADVPSASTTLPPEPVYPAAPVPSAEPVYPAAPVYPVETVYPPEPLSPVEPVYPTEPRQVPGSGETW